MLKHKYKIFAIAICFLFFLLALFSSAGFDPVRNLSDKFLCLIKVGDACSRISNGVNWKNSKYNGNGILADEIPHIAGGYYYLKTGRYFINPEHPPLVKDVAGLGELVINPTFPNITGQEELSSNYHRVEYPFRNMDFPKALEWANNQDHFGVMYLFHPANDPDRIAFWARLAVIFTNTILLFALFSLLSRLWNGRAALLGLFFFAVSQFSIAHGSYVVIDFMSAVLTIIAVSAFALYLKTYQENKRAMPYFFLTSLSFALALLSKFSSVVLLPAAFLGGLIFIIFIKKSWKETLKYIGAFLAVVTLTLFLISIFYAFHIYKAEDSILAQKIHENYPEEQLPPVGHKILEAMIYSNVLTKGFAAYINGVFMVVSRMVVSAQNTYFLGQVYGNEGAGGWYFPVLYLAKLSPGLHLFSIIALILLIYNFFANKERKLQKKLAKFFPNPLTLLLWVFIFGYMAITFSSTFQIGLRHIMPVILAAAVLTGRGVDLFWGKSLKLSFRLKHLFAAIAVLMLISVFNSFPYYLQYYNIFAGGTDRGYIVATDSNYDWGGSDVRRLAKWLRDNNVREIYTQIFADVPLKYYLGDGQKYFNLQSEGALPPAGSYIAVSNYEYMSNVYSEDIPPERKYTILEDNLVAKVGKTIFVYRVP